DRILHCLYHICVFIHSSPKRRSSDLVYSDIDKIMESYEQVATPELASEFYAELRQFMAEAARRPESFSIRERDIRRVNLERFPRSEEHTSNSSHEWISYAFFCLYQIT